jgi:hypothetical protein
MSGFVGYPNLTNERKNMQLQKHQVANQVLVFTGNASVKIAQKNIEETENVFNPNYIFYWDDLNKELHVIKNRTGIIGLDYIKERVYDYLRDAGFNGMTQITEVRKFAELFTKKYSEE